MPGELYLVATPIGNLEDITLRALRILREADLIACEDTRHTQKLLNHFNITTKTVSYHEHNEAERAQELIARIQRGESIALVSDAGTPALSDPGYRVLQAAIGASIPVIVVPGPSAAITALVGSGLPTDSFYFGGFLPARSGERRTALESHLIRRETMLFYEAPHRLREALDDLIATLGSERRIVVARELTKMHEEFLRGTAAHIAAQLASRGEVKGECVLLIAGATDSQPGTTPKSLAQRMRELLTSGISEKDALKTVAKELSLGKSEAYREWQRVKPR